jgi:hypothetical protein
LVPRFHQLGVTYIRLVDQFEIEPGGIAELDRRRWSEREGQCIPILLEPAHGAPGDCLNSVIRAGPFRPILEPNEDESGTLTVTAETEAGNSEH